MLDFPELFGSPRNASDTVLCDENALARALEKAEEILQYLDSEGEF